MTNFLTKIGPKPYSPKCRKWSKNGAQKDQFVKMNLNQCKNRVYVISESRAV